jgi:hypothetical protein
MCLTAVVQRSQVLETLNVQHRRLKPTTLLSHRELNIDAWQFLQAAELLPVPPAFSCHKLLASSERQSSCESLSILHGRF